MSWMVHPRKKKLLVCNKRTLLKFPTCQCFLLPFFIRALPESAIVKRYFVTCEAIKRISKVRDSSLWASISIIYTPSTKYSCFSHSPQSVLPQGFVLTRRWGHGLPPFLGCTLMWRLLVLVPVPQDTLHGVQRLQRDTLQSTLSSPPLSSGEIASTVFGVNAVSCQPCITLKYYNIVGTYLQLQYLRSLGPFKKIKKVLFLCQNSIFSFIYTMEETAKE